MKDVADPNNRSRPAGRPLLRYRDMQEFQKGKERPYIHLVDGGVSDNLGMRAILEGIEELEASPAYRNGAGLQGLRRIVVIVVNSRSVARHRLGQGRVGARRRSASSCSLPACRSTATPTSRSSC